MSLPPEPRKSAVVSRRDRPTRLPHARSSHECAGLNRIPITVDSEWISKIVTTDPPRYTPHTEWTLVIRVHADVPIRVVALLAEPDETAWGLQPDGPAQELELRALFTPHDWAKSDDVHISFGYQRLVVTDPAVKLDPRRVVKVESGSSAQTGRVTIVASVPAHAISLAVFALTLEDTQARRLHRWRVKPALAAHLPEQLVPLTSGHQSGVLRTEPK